MVTQRLILSGAAGIGTDPEEIGLFTNYFITDRALIWDKMVAIFQGSDAWTYIKPDKNHSDGRLGFRLIYNHYLVPSNIDHMVDSAEEKLVQFTYTGGDINCTFEKYATLPKEQHRIIESLK